MMKRYLFLCIAAMLTTIGLKAQTAGFNGNRLIICHNDGTKEVMATDSIEDIRIATIEESSVKLTALGGDDASLNIRMEMSMGCKRCEITCYPASEEIEESALEQYIKEHKTFTKTSDGNVTFINLKASTNYTIAALAYDEYDLPCRISSLTLTTEAHQAAAPAKIGDYLYADGTWSTEFKTTKTAIAIIYSLDVTDSDKAAGFTHGYAVALNNTPETAWTTEGGSGESGALFTNEDDEDISDREGLTHSNTLLENAEIHPAAVSAKNYAEAPESTSGWFLPSAGQLLEVCYSLGGLKRDAMTRNNGIATWSREDAEACIAKINERFAGAGEGNYTPMKGYFWTSTERSLMSAYYLYMNEQYNLSLQNYYKDTQFSVRPVIAF